MDFQIPCDCGKVLTVTEGSAGTEVTCACGRNVRVPSLGGLRQLAGIVVPHPAPELVIEQMLLAGTLPPDRNCVHCGAATTDLLTVHVECERAWRRGSDSTLSGNIGLFIGIFLKPISFLLRAGDEEQVFGRDKIYDLPLPVCPSCRAKVSDELAIWTSLRRVPEYRRLLEKFPEAKVEVLPG